MSSIASPAGALAFTYDAAGNSIRSLYSEGTDLKFTCDDNNRPTGSSEVQIGYDAAGWVSQSNGLGITSMVTTVSCAFFPARSPGLGSFLYGQQAITSMG